MQPWPDARVWEAVHAWHWIPPGAARIRTDAYEAAVVRGSWSLTYVWDFRVDDPAEADRRLDELAAEIRRLGGTGAKFQVTPHSRPADLELRLARLGFETQDVTEALVWELRDARDRPRLPPLALPPGVEVREVLNDPELDAFIDLAPPIFGDPGPTPEIRAGFHREAHARIRATGRSGRYLARVDGVPVGRAGLEMAGPVARLWGTGVLPAYRRRGIYGALVHARCLAAIAQSGEIALTTARVGSSGPILKRAGFRPVGEVRMLVARWEPSPAP
ncbi:MAG TPA: GNAT family N-acetyltransferase [Thermoplasmata archaeon]|nr:GNAT family N-acetyltransferase [Thermoplasmata archaeon]